MTKYISALFFITTLTAYGQLTIVKPTTFPTRGFDMHIFDDSEAYLVAEGPYIYKIHNVNDLENSLIEIKPAKLNGQLINLNKIWCFNKNHCIDPTRGYRTVDGGDTWTTTNSTSGGCSESGICVDPGRPYGVSVSFNYGYHWYTDTDYDYTGIIGSDSSSVFFQDGVYGKIYKVSGADSIKPLSSLSFPPISLLIPSATGFVYAAGPKIFFINAQGFNPIELADLNTTVQGTYDNDTIAFFTYNELYLSTDNGLSWQRDSITSDGFRWYDEHSLHHGKIYGKDDLSSAVTGAAGELNYLNILSKNWEIAGENALATNGIITKLPNNRFLLPTLKDSAGYYHAVRLDNNGNFLDKFSLPISWLQFQIDFADSLRGTATNGQKYSTTDGGQNWRRLSVSGLNTVFSKDGQCLITQDHNSFSLHAVNHSLIRTGPCPSVLRQEDIVKTYFETCNRGAFVLRQGLFYTNDGGISFQQVDHNLSASDRILDFKKTSSGYSYLSNTGIYTSDSLNGPYQLAGNFNGVPNMQWLTADHKIFGRDEWRDSIYVSLDSGQTYKSAFLPGDFSDVVMVDSVTSLIAGAHGQIYLLKASKNINVSLNESADDQIIHFFPNPAKTKVNLQFYNEGPHHLQLITVSGEIMLEEKVEAKKHQLDIQSLPGGMYFLKIKTAWQTQTKRLLKLD